MSRRAICLVMICLFALPVVAAAQPSYPESAPVRTATWDETALPGGRLSPAAIARGENGHIYVIDRGGHRIVVLLPDGTYAGEWGGLGSSPGEFNYPLGIAVGTDGSVYVADTGNHRVQKFDADGVFLDELTSFDTGQEWVSLQEPWGLDCDETGDLYVVDWGHWGVFKFEDDFTFLGSFDGGAMPGDKFNFPQDVAVDALGNIVVADTGNDRVMKFNAAFQLLTIWDSSDVPSGCDMPEGVAVDALRNIFVTYMSDRLLKLASDGSWLSVFPPGGSTDRLRRPVGLDVHGYGCIYVGNIDDDTVAVLGYPPEIQSVTDIPEDQGRWVRLVWRRSELDRITMGTAVSGYGVYRRQPGTAAKLRHSAADRDAAAPDKVMEGWDVIATVPARGDSTYALVAPTLADSTGSDPGWSVFVVSAFSSYANFFDSPADSGYSQDNIPPPVPAAPAVAENPGQYELLVTWQASAAPDLDHYAVYRGSAPDFTPTGPGDTYAVTTAPSFDDDAVASGETWYYRVAAFDDAEIFSGFSVAAGAQVVAATPSLPQPTWGLDQNVPNPFNPRTVIGFDLPRAARVHLAVYDLTGHHVQTLLTGERLDAGHRSVEWDGCDGSGQPVAAGVYCYRLETAAFSETRRMTLVR